MKLEMKRQDLEELYILLEMYEKTYGGMNVREMKAELSVKYRAEKGWGNISEKRNPRGAGRKNQYTEEERKRIRELRAEGKPVRRIAEVMGCSVGYVQGVLSDLGRRNVQ